MQHQANLSFPTVISWAHWFQIAITFAFKLHLLACSIFLSLTTLIIHQFYFVTYYAFIHILIYIFSLILSILVRNLQSRPVFIFQIVNSFLFFNLNELVPFMFYPFHIFPWVPLILPATNWLCLHFKT